MGPCEHIVHELGGEGGGGEKVEQNYFINQEKIYIQGKFYNFTFLFIIYLNNFKKKFFKTFSSPPPPLPNSCTTSYHGPITYGPV